MKKQVFKIKVSHKDPKIEKQGVKAIKDFIKTIGKLYGEDIKFYKTEKEASKTITPNLPKSK